MTVSSGTCLGEPSDELPYPVACRMCSLANGRATLTPSTLSGFSVWKCGLVSCRYFSPTWNLTPANSRSPVGTSARLFPAIPLGESSASLCVPWGCRSRYVRPSSLAAGAARARPVAPASATRVARRVIAGVPDGRLVGEHRTTPGRAGPVAAGRALPPTVQGRGQDIPKGARGRGQVGTLRNRVETRGGARAPTVGVAGYEGSWHSARALIWRPAQASAAGWKPIRPVR